MRVIKDLQAYRANGEGGYDHRLVPAGSSVIVASVHNQGFNGVKIFSHFDGWTLCADINDVVSYVDDESPTEVKRVMILTYDVQFKRELDGRTQRRVIKSNTVVVVDGDDDFNNVKIHYSDWHAIVHRNWLRNG